MAYFLLLTVPLFNFKCVLAENSTPSQVVLKMTHDLTKIDTGLKGKSVGISLICYNFNQGGFDTVF